MSGVDGFWTYPVTLAGAHVRLEPLARAGSPPRHW